MNINRIIKSYLKENKIPFGKDPNGHLIISPFEDTHIVFLTGNAPQALLTVISESFSFAPENQPLTRKLLQLANFVNLDFPFWRAAINDGHFLLLQNLIILDKDQFFQELDIALAYLANGYQSVLPAIRLLQMGGSFEGAKERYLKESEQILAEGGEQA